MLQKLIFQYLIRIYENKDGQSENKNHDVIDFDNSRIIKNLRILKNHLLFGIIKLVLHECSRNMKIYSPRKIIFPSGNMIFFWRGGGDKSSYFSHDHAINV